MEVSIVITGRHYDASSNVPSVIDLPAGASIDDALAHLAEKMPSDNPLPDSCLIALGSRHLGTLASHENASLSEGDELILIAPVAGG